MWLLTALFQNQNDDVSDDDCVLCSVFFWNFVYMWYIGSLGKDIFQYRANGNIVFTKFLILTLIR